MDHKLVVREKMTEKYLLGELEPNLRDEFEEHFFLCPECAEDVRAASDFVAHSKNILKESEEPQRAATPQREPRRREWFSWLRPQFAVPALAALLVVVGYQNLVTLPRLARAVGTPQVLPATAVNLLTYGASDSELVIHNGESFLINVIVPPGPRYTAYTVELYNPAGNLAESLPVSPSAADTWPIRFPGGDSKAGRYKLTVRGRNAGGQEVEVGSASFELRIQD
jgi:anti-sigma factor RsiW